MKIFRATCRFLLISTAIIIGLYPLIYYFADMHDKGLMSSKSPAILADRWWHTIFYIHISFGGIALLTGWSQFSSNFRRKNLLLHRRLGIVYIISVLLSSMAGLYIAWFATGGPVSQTGFSMLAVCWFCSVLKAYSSILNKDTDAHQRWMIRNYALAFSAVTLRIYLPLLSNFIFHDFTPAYRLVSWLCWVPNLFAAEWIIFQKKRIWMIAA